MFQRENRKRFGESRKSFGNPKRLAEGPGRFQNFFEACRNVEGRHGVVPWEGPSGGSSIGPRGPIVGHPLGLVAKPPFRAARVLGWGHPLVHTLGGGMFSSRDAYPSLRL